MNIRTATAADASPIATLHSASWRVTYSQTLSAHYLAETVGTIMSRLHRARQLLRDTTQMEPKANLRRVK